MTAMFVSIDMDNLVFLHKHHDHETLSALSWLECGQQVSIRVEPSHDNSRFLSNVSDLDVRMLYKNTTGRELPKDSDAMALRYQLGDMAQLMPVSRVLTHEVLAQVEAVDDRLHAGERFKYAAGARVPAQPAELFPLKARPLTDKELGEAHTRSRNPIPGYPPKLSGHAHKPWEAPAPQAPTPAPAARTAPSAPEPAQRQAGKARSGSVRPVVFAEAAKAWNAPERAAQGQTWENVRAALIEALTGPGFDFHPTTVRIKLSEWAKANGI